ncbi:MAG: hypothetical protein JXB32_00565, partial [Deltaproteobacteria bacterium]|nr:hypothetical protein [Deltaproteobacteria bacterium]
MPRRPQGGHPGGPPAAGERPAGTPAPATETADGAPARRPIRLLDTLPEQLAAVEAAARAAADGTAGEELLPLLRGLVRRYRGPLRERLVALGSSAAEGALPPERAAELVELVGQIRGGSRPRRPTARRAARATPPVTDGPPPDPLLAPAGSLKGVGPRLAERLAAQGV